MTKIWPFIHSHAFEKEEERLFFIFSGFLRKDDFIGLTQRCDDFDGHSTVSKMVIEFFSRPYNIRTTAVCLCMRNYCQNSDMCGLKG